MKLQKKLSDLYMETLMTETGSLGPIDAQTKIGRSTISDLDWVDNKRQEALQNNALNPFDAVMIAQISPGELNGVLHSLKFAEDLVVEWLVNYKFKNWDFTETRKIPVTPERKKERAVEIAQLLCKHSKWRSHGRSIKINDLEEIGLTIINIDHNPDVAVNAGLEVVERHPYGVPPGLGQWRRRRRKLSHRS